MVEFDIEEKRYRFMEDDYLNAGGTEGVIYDIKENKVAKILRKINQNKTNKILALCNKTENLSSVKGFENIAMPLSPAYDLDQNICGFAMTYFKNCGPVNDIIYDLQNKKYQNPKVNDSKVVRMIESLFFYLQLLHQNKIILGDLNAENILWNITTNEVHYIDIDSSKVSGLNIIENEDEYYAEMYKEEYVCPQVLKLGKNDDGGLPFSTSSDIYSLSIVCFEILIGTYPYEVGTNPVLNNEQKKEQQISFIDFHFKKVKKYKNISIADLYLYNLVKERLDYIQNKHPKIYQHFVEVFHLGKRNYFSKKQLVRTTSKIRRDIRVKPIRSYAYNRKERDPKGFNVFLNTYNLKLDQYA